LGKRACERIIDTECKTLVPSSLNVFPFFLSSKQEKDAGEHTTLIQNEKMGRTLIVLLRKVAKREDA
jgi:hypothetical protein